MKHHKTLRRKTHSKRKTHRRRGGATCDKLRARFEALKRRVHLMRRSTYENKHSRVRALYNEADRLGRRLNNNSDCTGLAKEVDEFENTILQEETRKLHGLPAQ